MREISLTINEDKLTVKQKICRKIVLHFLSTIKEGHIELHDPLGVISIGNKNSSLHACVWVHNIEFYPLTFFQGSIGFGNSYTYGYWTVDNLTNLIEIFANNLAVINKAEGHIAGLIFKFSQTLMYILQPNTVKHARENILSHYDLSNNFFGTFLDKSMSYSGLIFKSELDSLDQAAITKNLSLLNSLELSADDSLLEIGSGWGGLAIMAASEFGCKVSTTTISTQQFEYVREKIQSLNLDKLINLLNLDYRKLTGKYSKIISVEMIEAVGHQYFNDYFRICSDLLEDDGLFCLQTIVIRDQEYERAKNEVDFIKKNIFPGGCLPSLSKILTSVAECTDLSLLSVKDVTYDYACTLRAWRQRMLDSKQHIYQLGFDEQFIKTWEYYFSYCEAGFLQRNIMNLQIVFSKPGYKDKRQNA